MDNLQKMKSPMQPRPLAELLPGIKAILPEDVQRSLARRSVPNIPSPTFKPLTLAEIKEITDSFKKSPTPPSKRPWNSSVKIERKSPLATPEPHVSRTRRIKNKFFSFLSRKPVVEAENMGKLQRNAAARKSLPIPKTSKRKENEMEKYSSKYNNKSKYSELLELEKKEEYEIKKIDDIIDTWKSKRLRHLTTLDHIRSQLKSEDAKNEDKENLVESPK